MKNKQAKVWYCPECKRQMTTKQAQRAMEHGCPAGCSGIDIQPVVAFGGEVTTHTVTANEAGHYDVVSGNSGKTYRVWPHGGDLATCECPGFNYNHHCSHVDAVRASAAQVLTAQAWSEAMAATVTPADGAGPGDAAQEARELPVGVPCDSALRPCAETLHRSSESPFQRIERSERNWLRTDLTPWPNGRTELL